MTQDSAVGFGLVYGTDTVALGVPTFTVQHLSPQSEIGWVKVQMITECWVSTLQKECGIYILETTIDV